MNDDDDVLAYATVDGDSVTALELLLVDADGDRVDPPFAEATRPGRYALVRVDDTATADDVTGVDA